MSTSYVGQLGKELVLDPDEQIMPNLLMQYERVIVESIVTSFGLDMLIFNNPLMPSIADQHGGSVDTILNVRKIGIDSEMAYKSKKNQIAYETRDPYDYSEYHDRNKFFAETKREARKQYRDNNLPMEDAYTGGDIYFLGKSKNAPTEKNAQLEHVITTKTIAEDRGRVLAGLDGSELANCPENLKWINQSLNASLGATKDEFGNPVEIPDYIKLHPELPEETKRRMLKEYSSAKAAYEAKLARAYYHSPAFLTDTAKAAAKQGVAMGVRQLCGFVFMELWFGVREEFDTMDKSDSTDLAQWLNTVGEGIKKGFRNAQLKYKDALAKLSNRALAGALSSLTTTLCNIFFTTAKNVVRVIRQSWSSLTQAAEVLFLNPSNYSMGDRLIAVAKIIATGASIVVGTLVSEAVQETPIGKIPVVGTIIPGLCGSLVTGIMSCTLLYFFDRAPVMLKLVEYLNRVHTIEDDINYYQKQAEYFERYAAELMKIDIDQFQKETSILNCAVSSLDNATTEEELNQALKEALYVIGIEIPWKHYSSFRAYLADDNAPPLEFS